MKEKLNEKHDTWFKKSKTPSLKELKADNSDSFLDVYKANLKICKDQEFPNWYKNQLQLNMFLMRAFRNNLRVASEYISRLE